MTVTTLILLELLSCSCLCSTIPHIILLFVEKENVQLDVILDSSKRQLKAIFNLGKKETVCIQKKTNKQTNKKQKRNGKTCSFVLVKKFSLPFYYSRTHNCFPRVKQAVAFWLVAVAFWQRSTGSLFSAKKVLAEELRSRAENGEGTLRRSLLARGKAMLKKQFRQVDRLSCRFCFNQSEAQARFG